MDDPTLIRDALVLYLVLCPAAIGWVVLWFVIRDWWRDRRG